MTARVITNRRFGVLRIWLVWLIVATGASACQAERASNRSATPAAPHTAPVDPLLWPSSAYRVEWVETHIPDQMAADAAIAVPVTFRNIGDRMWPASLVRVAYHWFRDDRLVVWDGERTGLAEDLQPGGWMPLSLRVIAPSEPGSYILQLTLVRENVTWFEHKGANTVSLSVTVQ